jgi:enamine deaminase RidA (YjgF/YER057c/UK114 family)
MMPQKAIVNTDKAPKAIGPYSVANRIGDLVFTAGQTGLDPQTNELVPGGIQAETRQVLTNIKIVLEAAGSSLEQWSRRLCFCGYGRFYPNERRYAELSPESSGSNNSTGRGCASRWRGRD